MMTEQPLSRTPRGDKQPTIDAQEDVKQIGNSSEPFSPNITWLIEQMLYVKSTCRPDDVHGDIAEYVLDLNRQGFDMSAILSRLKMLADLARQYHEMRYADYAQFILRQVRKAKQKRMPMPLRWEDQPGMPKRWFLKEPHHPDRDENPSERK